MITVGAAAIVGAGGGTAAAAPLPRAQSVGNFVDATLGGNVLDPVAALKYARATAPGSNGVQNPLDVTALGAINLPLTGALQLPKLLGVQLGAVNQVAKAKLNGESYGASGAVSNSGGVSVGGENDAKPSAATIKLDGSAFGDAGQSLAALGGVEATIGAVGGYAATPQGYGKAGSTDYGIADVTLSVGSPLLAQTLGQLLGQVTTAFGNANDALKAVGALTGCTLTAPKVNPLELAGGAISIDTTTFKITISLSALLDELGVNLNSLPANTDLIDYLLAYLTDANGLAKGLQSTVNDILDPLQTSFDNCLTAVGANPVTNLLQQLSQALTAGKTQVNGLITGLITQLTSAAGTNPLKPLADGLKQLIDIGVNVQPNGPEGTYTDPLSATPKQGTSVVKNQTIVRAIEVNVAAAAGASLPTGGIPGLGDLGLPGASGLTGAAQAAPLAAAAAPAGQGILTLALGNAAAGPSVRPAVVVPTTAPAPTRTPANNTDIPTAIPAGAAGAHHDGGLPVLPLVALLALLSVSGAAYWQYRGRLGLGTRGH